MDSSLMKNYIDPRCLVAILIVMGILFVYDCIRSAMEKEDLQEHFEEVMKMVNKR